MPRVKPRIWTSDAQSQALRANIKICMLKTGIEPEDISKVLNVCKSSAYNKIRDPQKMQVEELFRLAHIFKVDVADLVKEGGV